MRRSFQTVSLGTWVNKGKKEGRGIATSALLTLQILAEERLLLLSARRPRSPARQDLPQAAFRRRAGYFAHARAVWVHRVDMTIAAEGYLAAVG